MAFRHHYFHSTPVDRSVKFQTLVSKPVSVSGSVPLYSTVALDDSVLNCSIPSPLEYTLENLLNANIPLQRVNVSLDNLPTTENIENFINNLKIEENED